MIFPMIMAGGRGERFWPYSNRATPKQLLPLVTGNSMLEDTLAHIQKLKSSAPVHIIASSSLEKPMGKILRGRPGTILIGEPQGRDTAPAVALACRLISGINPKGVMAVLTADHVIRPNAKLIKCIKAAAKLAEKGDTLVTMGIRPSRPEIGYGYIESMPAIKKVYGLESRKVKKFHEKPNLARARRYLRSGRHFWNSGMFAWRVDYLWDLYRQFLPNIHQAFEKAGVLQPGAMDFKKKLKTIYNSLEKISVDFGILEKAPRISVVIPDFHWDDVGSWTALERLHKADKHGNLAIGKTIALDTENTTCFSTSGMIAAYGVKDLLIVQHNSATLVIRKDKRAELKKLVNKLKGNPGLEKFL
jgi:mannose-1-phosphate guanylyltransferase